MKARFLAFAALVLGLVSCQNEPDEMNVSLGGEQEVMLTVSLPEATRADSADGALDNDVLTDYDLRYILEVYYGEKCNRFVQTSTSTSAVFPVRLAPGREYTFVVWADFVTKGANAENDIDLFYETSDGLKAIQIIEDMWAPMVEARDAYFFSKTIADFQTSSNLEMTLTRPFAKVRVVSTDIEQLRGVGIVPTTAQAIYSQNMYRKFNAATGVASDAATKTHTFAYANVDGYEANTDSKLTIFSDYIFVPAEGVAKFTLEVWDGETPARSIKQNNFNTDIFVEKNKVTSIVGDVLTTGGNVKVTIDGDLGEKETITVIDNAQSLQDAINNAPDGEETIIELGGDIDLGDLFGAGIFSTRATTAPLPIVVAEGKSLVLELNGYKITTPWENQSEGKHYYAFDNKGSLTIQDSKGNGEIIARGIFNYGTMTLKSGTINACDGNGGYGVRNYEGAEFIMNGGSIVTSLEDDHQVDEGGYDATTLRVDSGAKATINGGTINNICDFTYAIDNNGEVVVNGGEIKSVHSTVSTYGTMTINGGSFTCNGLEGITAHALVAWVGSKTTINGGTFDGKDNFNGFNVDTDAGAVVNIYGGKFLPVHSGSLYGEGTINVMGGEFFDDPSERVNDDYTVVETNDGNNTVYTVVRKPDVAKIGEVGYTSLAKAVAAVKDGETITLVANEVFTENNYYDNGGWKDGLGYAGDKSFTLDLGGNTISQDGYLNDYLLWFKNVGSKDNTITIKNGTLDAGTTAYSALCTASSNEHKITINIENINLVGNNSNGAVAKIRGGSELNVNAGTVITGKNNYVGIEAAGNNTVVNIYDNAKIYQNGTDSYVGAIVGASQNATMNIYGGYGKSAKCGIIVMSTGATINVSGGEWIANNDGTVANDNNAVLVSQNNRYEKSWACKSILNVTGGTFKGGYNCYGMGPGVEPDDAQINIKGGNFNSDPANYVVAGYKVVEENGIWTVVVDPVAKIGETEYASLQEAFNVGGEITLLRDITIAETVVLAEGKTVVLDLNGKTLSAVDMNTIKNNGGNLTIKNGTVTRTGDVVGYSVNNASGEIAVENATIERGLYTSGSKMTATNANISHEQSSRHAIYAWDCAVTINSGNFHNDNAGNATLMASGSSIVTINGGTFSIADGRSTLGWTSSMIDQNSTAQVIVKGGLFNGGFRINSADTTLTIEGGEFNTNNGSAFTDYSGTKVVKGGKFTDDGAQNWAKKYIAEGYEMNANGEVVAK